jgi:hypothetical protein
MAKKLETSCGGGLFARDNGGAQKRKQFRVFGLRSHSRSSNKSSSIVPVERPAE